MKYIDLKPGNTILCIEKKIITSRYFRMIDFIGSHISSYHVPKLGENLYFIQIASDIKSSTADYYIYHRENASPALPVVGFGNSIQEAIERLKFHRKRRSEVGFLVEPVKLDRILIEDGKRYITLNKGALFKE